MWSRSRLAQTGGACKPGSIRPARLARRMSLQRARIRSSPKRCRRHAAVQTRLRLPTVCRRSKIRRWAGRGDAPDSRGRGVKNAADEPGARYRRAADATTLAWGLGRNVASREEAGCAAPRRTAGVCWNTDAPTGRRGARARARRSRVAGLHYGWNVGVPVGETACILTDHMLLPLSWNRDAYYVARALLGWRVRSTTWCAAHLL